MSKNLELSTLNNSPANLGLAINERLDAVDALLTDETTVAFSSSDLISRVNHLSLKDFITYGHFIITDSVTWVTGEVNFLVVPDHARGSFTVYNNANRRLAIATVSQMGTIDAAAPVAASQAPVIHRGAIGSYWCDGSTVRMIGSTEEHLTVFIHSPIASNIEYIWTSSKPFTLMSDNYAFAVNGSNSWTGYAATPPSSNIIFDLALDGSSVGILILTTTGRFLVSIAASVQGVFQSYLTITSPADLKGAARIAISGYIHY